MYATSLVKLNRYRIAPSETAKICMVMVYKCYFNLVKNESSYSKVSVISFDAHPCLQGSFYANWSSFCIMLRIIDNIPRFIGQLVFACYEFF